MKTYETTVEAADGTVLWRGHSPFGAHVIFDDQTLAVWQMRGATMRVKEIETPEPGPRRGLMRFSR